MAPRATRRQFLRVGTFGAAFTLADLLRADAARKGAGRTKSAILVYLSGGPSQLDGWDPKPDAPAEIRGEFGTIPTRVPGVRVCEHFPLQAKLFDRLAVLRSVVGMAGDHSDVQVMTGYPSRTLRAGGHPSFGSVVSRMRGTGAMPPFVSLRGMTAGTEPGFLGVAHRPFSPAAQAGADLRLSPDVPAARLDDRRKLLATFDDVRRDADASGAMAGMDSFQQRAFEMVMSGRVRAALSLVGEDAKALERFDGAEQFLKARRLVEAGVGCVTLNVGEWDTHRDNFRALRQQLPLVDRGVSALVEDLHERGLADDVAVLVWGEFGRTPRVNAGGGRDHWTAVMSAVLAGGGLKVGQAVGATDRRGEQPSERPYTVQQVLATLYRAVGIDPATTIPDATGRPVHLLDDRDPIRELVK
jgi:hypothetical protein